MPSTPCRVISFAPGNLFSVCPHGLLRGVSCEECGATLTDAEISYDLEFVRDVDGRRAVEDQDYRILERPVAMAHRISGRSPSNA